MTRRSNIAILAVVALLPTLAGCAQQAPKTTTPSATAPKEPVAPPPPSRQPSRSGGGGSVAIEVSRGVGGAAEHGGFADEPALKDVFFDPTARTSSAMG